MIFSGLWGVVTPTDLLPDYKLKMGASLAPMGRLGTFWRPQISAALAPFVEGRTVWDLLPNEHAAAWQPAGGSLRCRISGKFLDEVPAGRQQVGAVHWNKLLKGRSSATSGDPARRSRGPVEFRSPHGLSLRVRLTTETGDGVTPCRWWPGVLIAATPFGG